MRLWLSQRAKSLPKYYIYLYIKLIHVSAYCQNRPFAFSKLGLLSGDIDQKVSIQPIITEHYKNTVYIDVLIENHSIWIYIVLFCVTNFRLHPKYIYLNPFYTIGVWGKGLKPHLSSPYKY